MVRGVRLCKFAGKVGSPVEPTSMDVALVGCAEMAFVAAKSVW